MCKGVSQALGTGIYILHTGTVALQYRVTNQTVMVVMMTRSRSHAHMLLLLEWATRWVLKETAPRYHYHYHYHTVINHYHAFNFYIIFI